MIVVCAWCKKPMGEKPPYEDKSVTHTICEECLRKYFPKVAMTQISGSTIAPTKMQQILEAGRRQLSPEEFEELAALLTDLGIYGLTPWINVELGKLMAKIKWELEIGPSPEWAEALQACDYAFLGSELKTMCYEAGASPVGHKKQLCARLYKRKVPEVVAVMEPYLKGMTPERIKEEIERYAKVILPQTEEWHPDYIAFLRTLRGKNLADFDIRSEQHPAGFKHSYYRAYLGSELIVGAESREEVVRMLKQLLERVKLLETERLPQAERLYASKLRKVKDRLEELRRTSPDEFYRRKSLIEQAIKEREKGYQRTMPDFSLAELKELIKFTERLYR